MRYEEQKLLERRRKREQEIEAERMIHVEASKALQARERRFRLEDEDRGLTEEQMRQKVQTLRAAREAEASLQARRTVQIRLLDLRAKISDLYDKV